MSLSQLTIVGAGLIGGSIALGARASGAAERIVALDQMENPGGESASIFDEWVKADEPDAVARCLKESSLTMLCVPVRGIVQILPSILRASRGPVSDCGSTKQAIVQSVAEHVERFRFVAGHPMAGHPQGGLVNARADLFRERKWIICPDGSDPQSVDVVRELVEKLGARCVELSTQEHDRAVAITSHIPQVVASALSVHALENGALKAAGPGYASATRVAGGAEAMWRDIFDTNHEAIGLALADFGKRLQMLGEELQTGQVSGTLAVLELARKSRES